MYKRKEITAIPEYITIQEVEIDTYLFRDVACPEHFHNLALYEYSCLLFRRLIRPIFIPSETHK